MHTQENEVTGEAFPKHLFSQPPCAQDWLDAYWILGMCPRGSKETAATWPAHRSWAGHGRIVFHQRGVLLFSKRSDHSREYAPHRGSQSGERFSYPWLAARLETFTVPKSDGVVCITRYTQEAMSGLARRTWLLPNAVDSAFFAVNSSPPAGKPPRILCVGLVCPRKNQNAFIRSLDPLAEKHRFELVFLGSVTPGRAYDDEFLALVRARSWCSHVGFASREALRNQFQDAALVALPSIEDNCPMAVPRGYGCRITGDGRQSRRGPRFD